MWNKPSSPRFLNNRTDPHLFLLYFFSCIHLPSSCTVHHIQEIQFFLWNHSRKSQASFHALLHPSLLGALQFCTNTRSNPPRQVEQIITFCTTKLGRLLLWLAAITFIRPISSLLLILIVQFHRLCVPSPLWPLACSVPRWHPLPMLRF